MMMNVIDWYEITPNNLIMWGWLNLRITAVEKGAGKKGWIWREGGGRGGEEGRREGGGIQQLYVGLCGCPGETRQVCVG